MLPRLGIALVAFVLGVACGGAGWRTSLSRRASFDLQCPEESLDMQELGAAQFGVRGCGCQATYIDSNGAGASRRMGAPQWVLNATSGTCQAQVQSTIAQQQQ